MGNRSLQYRLYLRLMRGRQLKQYPQGSVIERGGRQLSGAPRPRSQPQPPSPYPRSDAVDQQSDRSGRGGS